jgi:hypothetical protein
MAAADGTAPEQFYYCRVSRREQSLRPRHTTVASRGCGGSPGEPGDGDCSRRDRRRGKSGLEALRAASPAIRHWRTGKLVAGTIIGCPSRHPRRRRHRKHHRRKARFSTPSNRSRPQARPVSRRYAQPKTRERGGPGCPWVRAPRETRLLASTRPAPLRARIRRWRMGRAAHRPRST